MTRHGKIARLPRAVREKLNERLDNGESGVKLARWLNGLKEVKKVLRTNFGGRSITPQNLSKWKCGGFVEWQARQESLEQARELSAQAKELNEATMCRLTDNLATVLAARYAKVLSGWDGKVTEEFSAQLRVLRSMCLDVAELRRGDHNRERVELEKGRWEQNREQPERKALTPEELEERYRRIFGMESRSDSTSAEASTSPEAKADGSTTATVEVEEEDDDEKKIAEDRGKSNEEGGGAENRARETGETPVALAQNVKRLNELNELNEAGETATVEDEDEEEDEDEGKKIRVDPSKSELPPLRSDGAPSMGLGTSCPLPDEKKRIDGTKEGQKDGQKAEAGLEGGNAWFIRCLGIAFRDEESAEARLR